MELSDFTIRLIIILIPGAIATLIVEALTVHKKWAQLRFILSAIILGGISFGLQQILYWTIQLFWLCDENFSFKSLKIWSSIFEEKSDLNPIEIVFCLPISIIIGYLISFVIQRRFLFKIAKKLKVTRKYGDDNLYYYFLSKDEVDWVYIRDKINGFTYRGQVSSFSEDEINKEIVLYNVTVYDYERSDELYTLDKVYLKFNARDVIIEIPQKT
jgi:hypothetical protein